MRTIPLAVALVALVAAPAFAQGTASGVGTGPSALGVDREERGDIERDVAEVADDAEDVDTFVAGIAALDIADRLRSQEGPFTLLAPTDGAFEALPRSVLEGLLLEENDDRLEAMILNHVVEGRLDAEDLAAAGEIETLEGEEYDPEVVDGALVIGGARVVTYDLEAANGVVHVIDGVLRP